MDEKAKIGQAMMSNNKNQIQRDLYMYKSMARIRKVEEEIAKKYSEGKMRCPTHLSIGQESTPAILGLLLQVEDKVVSTHRCHAHYLAKGGSINAMIAELYGKETGCCGGKGGSMHLIDKEVGFMGSSAIVGNSIPVGTGIALALKLQKSRNISVVFIGDGATEEGVFYESLNFAALKELNVLYVCENNLYSVYSPLSSRQPKERDTIKIAQGLGIQQTLRTSGFDAQSLYIDLDKIIKEMRSQGGPAFVEISTYRWREHCGPNFDNDIGYRDLAEYEKYKSMDPLTRLEMKLIDDFVEFPEWKKTIFNIIEREITSAFDFAESSNYPKNKKLMEEIYAVIQS